MLPFIRYLSYSKHYSNQKPTSILDLLFKNSFNIRKIIYKLLAANIIYAIKELNSTPIDPKDFRSLVVLENIKNNNLKNLEQALTDPVSLELFQEPQIYTCQNHNYLTYIFSLVFGLQSKCLQEKHWHTLSKEPLDQLTSPKQCPLQRKNIIKHTPNTQLIKLIQILQQASILKHNSSAGEIIIHPQILSLVSKNIYHPNIKKINHTNWTEIGALNEKATEEDEEEALSGVNPLVTVFKAAIYISRLYHSYSR